MKYIIAASVSTDDVYQSNGTFMSHVLGGSGLYALCGIRLFTNDVVITSGVGPSYLGMHGKWYEQNDLSIAGLAPRCDDSITLVDYRKSEDRTDSPSNGLNQFRKRDPSPKDVEKFIGDETKGIYTFRHYDKEFLEALIGLRNKYGLKLLWEISEDACTIENREGIENILKDIDIFSINRHELCLLYDTDDEKKALDCLRKKISNFAFVRRGKDGAVAVDGSSNTVIECKTSQMHKVIDTTGCGNASSAAFLYGFTETGDLKKAGIMGSVAASFVLAQFGPPPCFTEKMRTDALGETQHILQEK